VNQTPETKLNLEVLFVMQGDEGVRTEQTQASFDFYTVNFVPYIYPQHPSAISFRPLCKLCTFLF